MADMNNVIVSIPHRGRYALMENNENNENVFVSIPHRGRYAQPCLCGF